jgi:sugar phosphate permease
MIPRSHRRWLILALASAMFVISHFYRASVAVITPDLTVEIGLDARELSLVSAAFFYAFALMQIPVGLFLDNIGPRITMTVLTLVAGGGALLFAWGNSVTWLTMGRVLLGVGMACNLMGSLKLLTLWFEPRHFATLSAVVTSVGTAGSIAAATPLVLAVAFMGWRNTFIVMATMTFALCALFYLVVRDYPGTPSERGDANGSSSGVELADTIKSAQYLFRSRDFWIISLSTFCRYGIYAAVQALWAGPYLMEVIGLTPVATGNALFGMNIGFIVGSPLSGWLSDRLYSRKEIIITGLVGMVTILLLLAFMPSGTHPVMMGALFTILGLFGSAGQVMYAHIKEQVPLENAGLAMTGINFFTMVGVAVFLQGLGNIMARLFPEASFGASAFQWAYLFCAACLALTAVLYCLTRETLHKRAN